MYMKSDLYKEQVFNILVIEDLLSWQKKFRRFLQDEPFNTVIAASYLEALWLSGIYSFDLLILDINLSGVPYNIDGLRAADKLIQQNKTLKLIVVSGDQGWIRHMEGYNFRPRFILQKQNLDQDDFVKKIYQALSEETQPNVPGISAGSI